MTRNLLYLAIQVQQIKRGDEVLVKTDKNLVKGLQVDHGGWNEAMVSVSQEQNLLVAEKKNNSMNKKGIKRIKKLWTHLHNVNKGLDELCRLSLLRVSSSKSL